MSSQRDELMHVLFLPDLCLYSFSLRQILLILIKILVRELQDKGHPTDVLSLSSRPIYQFGHTLWPTEMLNILDHEYVLYGERIN